MLSPQGPKGPLIDQGHMPLWQSYLGGGPLVLPSLPWHNGGFLLALIRYWQIWCCVDKLLRLRQVTWKSTNVNLTLVWSLRGPQEPLIDQDHRPLGKAIKEVALCCCYLCGGTMEFFLALIRYWQSWSCSGKLLRLRQVTWKRTDVYLTLVRSQRGLKGPLIDHGHKPCGNAI